jgi:hypothetical protein
MSRPLKNNTACAGLNKGWRRATFIVREDHYDFVKKMAYIRKESIKDFLDKLLEREYKRITLSTKDLKES